MKNIRKELVILVLSIFLSVNAACQAQKSSVSESVIKIENKKKRKQKKYKLPKIDLSHWSVTTPKLNDKGGAMNIESPEILKYGTDKRLLPYMYNDSIHGALVFYAFPSNATTANTKYSRAELREQIEPGSNDVNWTFKQGGKMKGVLEVHEISSDAKGKPHKVIIMQIHGRLTDAQRDLIGQKDNNAPPILKIYWDKGRIRVKTKVLKNLEASDVEILHKEAWGDDEGYTFKEEVGHKKFTLEVKVSDGKLTVVLNNVDYKVYDDINMEKWSVFENYFKAGNYFQSRDKGAYAKVKYYKLEVNHE